MNTSFFQLSDITNGENIFCPVKTRKTHVSLDTLQWHKSTYILTHNSKPATMHLTLTGPLLCLPLHSGHQTVISGPGNFSPLNRDRPMEIMLA